MCTTIIHLFYRYFIDAPNINGEMHIRGLFQNGREYDMMHTLLHAYISLWHAELYWRG